jgi:phosphoglycolate phosphatase
LVAVRAGGSVFDVDGVVFDKDGTLLDLDRSWGRAAATWIRMAAGEHREPAVALADALGFDLVEERLIPNGVLAAGTVGQIAAESERVLVRLGLDPAEAARRVLRARRAAIEAAEEDAAAAPLGDVAGTFRRLHEAGLRLAVVTSDDHGPAVRTLAGIGVAGLVDVVVAGDGPLPPKPSPASILAVAERLELPAARMLMVGDSVVDVAAARAAGVTAVVAVGAVDSPAAALADAVVRTVEELEVGEEASGVRREA